MTVKFPFQVPPQKDHSRIRINRMVMREKRKSTEVMIENTKLQQHVWRLQKKVQLLNKRQGSTQNPDKSVATPIKEADSLLRNEGLSPGKVPKIRKVLVAHNSVMKGLKNAKKQSRKNVLEYSHLDIYGSTRYVTKSLGIGRKIHYLLDKARRKQTQSAVNREMLKRAVISFMTRCDNATCCPGKRDAVKVGKELAQKYILSDTLKNLHKKFLLEYPNKSISFTRFCRFRPKNVLLIRYASRKVCLCEKHQNMALKLRALHVKKVVGFSLRPDDLVNITREEAKEKLLSIHEEHMQFMEWRRTEQPYKETVIKKTVLKQVTMSKHEFINKFLDDMDAFSNHARRVTEQYQQMKLLKDTMPSTHVTVQLDFAENYVCQFGEEVQSAYYSKSQVTIHPAVIIYKKPEEGNVQSQSEHSGLLDEREEGNMQAESEQKPVLLHKSIVIVSDETAHTAATIFAFLKELVPKVQKVVPDVEVIHYLSDSPTSQYRNCNMFNITAMHKSMFNVSASWQYFESGHGKGPCDGVGGAVKRSADLAVKKGAMIQTAQEFFNWGLQQDTAVDYLMVNKQLVKEASEEMLSLEATSVPGTMKFHSVMPLPSGVYFRETSCFKSCCWNHGIFTPTCDGWIQRNTRKVRKDGDKLVDRPASAQIVDVEGQEAPINPDTEEVHSEITVTHDITVEVNKAMEKETTAKSTEDHTAEPIRYTGYVAVLYEDKPYVGSVVEYDKSDNEYKVKFMESSGKASNVYKWPTREDELWIPIEDMLFSMEEPVPTGKTMRLFKISQRDSEALTRFL